MTEWLTVQQAMRRVGVARRTIYNWIADGKLVVCHTPGGMTRIDAASLFRPVDAPPPDPPPDDA